jgi:hypothetical protein
MTHLEITTQIALQEFKTRDWLTIELTNGKLSWGELAHDKATAEQNECRNV